MMAMTTKPVRPSQGACRLDLPCNSNSPSEGEPGGRPKPRKSSEVSVVIEPIEDEGQEGQGRHHGVGQHVPQHDACDWTRPKRARRAHIIEIARAQKFGAHDMDQIDPGKQQQDAEQHEKARRDDRRQDDQQVELRQRRPDFDEALHERDRSSRRNSPAPRRRRRRPPRKCRQATGRTARKCGSRKSAAPATSRPWSSVPSQFHSMSRQFCAGWPSKVLPLAHCALVRLQVGGEGAGSGGREIDGCRRNSGSAARSSSHWPRSL